MPFDMDVPVQPAYGTVTTGNIGMSDISSNALVNTAGMGLVEDVEAQARASASRMENIETDRIPCPRLCGASFGSGGGAIVIFHNGEVKKMWDWYQKTDTIRLSSVPGGQVDTASPSDQEMLLSKGPSDPTKKRAVVSSTGPRSLKELTDMMTTAKEVSY
jgi:hypothetical protein